MSTYNCIGLVKTGDRIKWLWSDFAENEKPRFVSGTIVELTDPELVVVLRDGPGSREYLILAADITVTGTQTELVSHKS
jgi:hypothetical protein